MNERSEFRPQGGNGEAMTETINKQAMDMLLACGLTQYSPEYERHTPHVRTIARIARRYGRIQELWCSVELSDRMTAYYEERETRMEQHVARLARGLIADGLVTAIEFNGDPRGYAIKFKLATKRSNDMGGETWGLG
jgi:hypothetical protein